MKRSRYVAQAGLIAAVYASATLLAQGTLQVLAWGPVQFRVSEVVTVLAMFTPAAIPGLTIGSMIANLYLVFTGAGLLGLLDVVFGSIGTLIGAIWMWRFRKTTWLALLGPVLSNALIVPIYLPMILKAIGFFDQTYALLNSLLGGGVDWTQQWWAVYLFGVVFVGLGQAVVMYGLGLPLLVALRRLGVERMIGSD